jgi:FkbM family methyltransferase
MAEFTDLPLSLRLKSRVIGSPFEGVAKNLRWLWSAPWRYQHPELGELCLEEQRLPFVLRKILQKDSCAIDVGAHIGSFLSSILRYAPNGNHIAIEPSVIRSNLLRRRFPKVLVLETAIADRDGTAIFEENWKNLGFSRLQRAVSQTSVSRYEVKTMRLDDLDVRRVDFIKLDIEGAELLALKGGKALINKYQPVILFECGAENADKEERRELYECLTLSIKYEIYTFTDFLFPRKGPLLFDEFRKCGIYPFRAFNFLALPRRRAI